jgi:type IV secretory pathway VirB2 component (pilin)
MKKSMKIISILMMAIMMIMVATPVFADVDPGKAIDDVKSKVGYGGNTDFTAKVGKIIGFLQWAGAIAGVLIITIFGIKYMMGSLEEKAEYKKTMIPFIVGAIVLIAAPQIAKLIFSIFA